ncbi:PREDICTED: uncharacterized protein LOC106810644 [Priapulus caudatus]|uniref:Uncharacterized protein LOC106810644 n=1 Tax=Priapulus caudatus TaxID=37621 RepID=A0ABM1EBI5_PRICU|nr:PREDICTED: uncharacterized protein LOC106810644 [Priapulus caudatus]
MGIIGAPRDHFFVDGNDLNILNDIANNLEAVELDNGPFVGATPRRRVKGRVRAKLTGGSKASLCDSKAMGNRKGRRYNNTMFLLNLEEIDDGDVNIYDFISGHISPFAQLIAEKEKMESWNDFINSSENEQQTILESGYSDHHFLGSISPVKQEGSERLAYTGQDCFKRLDGSLQFMVLRRHFPTGMLAHLEQEVTSFFSCCSDLVMVITLGSSFERYVLHAICQFLKLRSHSHDSSKGKRETHIENPHRQFLVPPMSLQAYIIRHGSERRSPK